MGVHLSRFAGTGPTAPASQALLTTPPGTFPSETSTQPGGTVAFLLPAALKPSAKVVATGNVPVAKIEVVRSAKGVPVEVRVKTLAANQKFPVTVTISHNNKKVGVVVKKNELPVPQADGDQLLGLFAKAVPALKSAKKKDVAKSSPQSLVVQHYLFLLPGGGEVAISRHVTWGSDGWAKAYYRAPGERQATQAWQIDNVTAHRENPALSPVHTTDLPDLVR